MCNRNKIDLFFEDKNRTYLCCIYCKLVFVPRRFWLNIEDEKATYDLHENNSLDQGYRKFLSRLCVPLSERLHSKQKGLDFGCGPGPTISVILEEQGHKVDLYDPLYLKNLQVFNKNYDFICATEVVEHLHNPNTEFAKLFNMLRRDGWLGIMTKLVQDKKAFSKWHYIRDMTHVCFYSRCTFEYIAKRFNAELEIVGNDVVLLQKRYRNRGRAETIS